MLYPALIEPRVKAQLHILLPHACRGDTLMMNHVYIDIDAPMPRWPWLSIRQLIDPSSEWKE